MSVENWINLGALGVAIFAAVVAVVQARGAGKDRQAAEVALAAAKRAAAASEHSAASSERQAVAAEKSLELQLESQRPAAWTSEHVSGHTHAAINTSGKTIIVVDVDVEPAWSLRSIEIYGNDTATYLPGDRMEYKYSRDLPDRPHKMTINWRFEDQPPHDREQTLIIL